MKFIYIITITINIFIVISCSNHNKANDKKIDEINLVGKILSASENLKGSRINFNKDSIFVFFVNNYSPAYEICLLKEDSLLLIGEFLERGNGPNEIKNPSHIHNPKSGNIFFYSSTDFTNIYYTPFSTENLTDTKKWNKIKFNLKSDFIWSGQHNSAQALNDEEFICIGGKYNDNNMISLVMADSVINIKNYNFPDDGFEGENIVKRIGYSNGQLFKKPDENKYVYINDYGEHVDIFELNNLNADNIINLYSDYPVYSTEDGLNRKYDHSKTKNGFDGYVNSANIYLLQSPYKSMKEWIDSYKINSKRYPNYARNRMLVYDWNGTLVKVYKLDIPLVNFIVTNDNNHIFGTTSDLENEEEIIVRYSLN